MENAKNYNNLKHLEAPSICKSKREIRFGFFHDKEFSSTGKNLFSKDEPEDSANVYNEPQPKLIQISSFSRKVFIGGLPPDIDKCESLSCPEKESEVTTSRKCFL